MNEFDLSVFREEEFDAKKLACFLLNLSHSEFDELVKAVAENFSLYDQYTKPMPSEFAVATLVDAIGDKDEESCVGKIKISEFLNKYDELLEKHNEDEMWLEDVGTANKFYREFFYYIENKAVGNKERIFETIAEQSRCWFEGYVKVTKRVNEKQQILIDFVVKDSKYTAEWQPEDNYAVWQTSGMVGDDYNGFLLLPTIKDDEYFLMYYVC